MTTPLTKVNYFNKITADPRDDTLRVPLTSVSYSSLNPHDSNHTLRIIAFSDTHGEHEVLGQLPHCDILIFCGNMLNESKKMTDAEARTHLEAFNEWLGKQSAIHKIIIGGNHDVKLEELQQKIFTAGIAKLFSNATYLCNSSVTIQGLNIVGLPFSVKDSGNQGFQSNESVRASQDYLNYLIEKNTKVDILITHGPCENIGTMLKPKLAHFSGRAKANYGITRVMHAPLEIEEISNRNRSVFRKIYTVTT